MEQNVPLRNIGIGELTNEYARWGGINNDITGITASIRRAYRNSK